MCSARYRMATNRAPRRSTGSAYRFDHFIPLPGVGTVMTTDPASPASAAERSGTSSQLSRLSQPPGEPKSSSHRMDFGSVVG